MIRPLWLALGLGKVFLDYNHKTKLGYKGWIKDYGYWVGFSINVVFIHGRENPAPYSVFKNASELSLTYACRQIVPGLQVFQTIISGTVS